MPINSVGIVTSRDDFVFDFDKAKLTKRIEDFLDSKLSDQEARKYLREKDKLNVSQARQEIRKASWSDKVVPCLYRPFDIRYLFYHDAVIERPRREVMRHMLAGENVGLIARRQMIGELMSYFFSSKNIISDGVIRSDNKGSESFFPLYLYPTEPEIKGGVTERKANFNPDFIEALSARLGLRFLPHPPSPSPFTERGWPKAGGEVASRRKTTPWQTAPELWAKLKPLAREMRHDPTPAEDKLWQRLRNRQLLHFKFRRQHALERFIVDFYCAEAHLVIEVEGPIHQYTQEEDAVRQEFLESLGLRVLCFTNDEITTSLDAVLKRVTAALVSGEPPRTFTPEDVFHYIYAVLHSPTYRKRYAEFLKIDFPCIPLTSDLELFRKLCQKGADLVALHLLEPDYAAASWNLDKSKPNPFHNVGVRYPVSGDDAVEKGHPKYFAPGEKAPGSDEPLKEGRVYISAEKPRKGKRGQYFEGVPPEVWAFHVGGYQVCEKWLKDRQGQKLSYDDKEHYKKIVMALGETIRLMREIDSTIEQHGGWPIQ